MASASLSLSHSESHYYIKWGRERGEKRERDERASLMEKKNNLLSHPEPSVGYKITRCGCGGMSPTRAGTLKISSILTHTTLSLQSTTGPLLMNPITYVGHASEFLKACSFFSTLSPWSKTPLLLLLLQHFVVCLRVGRETREQRDLIEFFPSTFIFLLFVFTLRVEQTTESIENRIYFTFFF